MPALAPGGEFAPWAMLSVLLLAAATALAIVVPDVGFVVSLSGALLCSLLVYSVRLFEALIGTRANLIVTLIRRPPPTST